VSDQLKPLGFKRTARRCWKEVPFGSLAVSFQKSVENTKNDTYFTADFLIRHDVIARMLKELGYSSFNDVQYRQRIGSLLVPQQDFWWHLSLSSDFDALQSEVLELVIHHGIHELLKYQTEQSLRDLWLSGRSPGLTEPQRLICLAILLTELGDDQALGDLESAYAIASKGQTRAIDSIFAVLKKRSQK
jgi:hypothetical protein